MGRHFPDFVAAALACASAVQLWRRSTTGLGRFLPIARALILSAIFLVLSGVLTGFVTVAQQLPPLVFVLSRASALLAAGALVYVAILVFFFGRAVRYAPQRRELLQLTAAAALSAPAALLATAYVKRDKLEFREVDIRVPNLPKDLEGLRIVQVSDLHLSHLVSEKLVAQAVDMANGAAADLAVLTGDFISVAGDPLDACLRQMARLRASNGIYACLGNHEEYAKATEYCTEAGARFGIQFLRQQAFSLPFGSARLNIAGVDYQSKRHPYLVGAETLVKPEAFNLLLSHNPDVFPVAAGKGFDLTLSGHTHGGQVNIELLHTDLNIVRFMTPYVYGSYQHAGKSIYVTRGVGTIGLPARLGAPPEVALIRLCGISS